MKKILFIGQLTDNSGYGNAARSYVASLSALHEQGLIDLKLLNYSHETDSVPSEEDKAIIKKYSLADHGIFDFEGKINYFTENNVKKIQKYLDDNKNQFYVISLVVPNIYASVDNKKLHKEWKVKQANNSIFIKHAPNMLYITKYSAGIYPCFVWEYDNIPAPWIESFKVIDNKIIKFISACSWNKDVVEEYTNKKSCVIPYMVKQKIHPDGQYADKLKEVLRGKYTFCMTGELQSRKGYDILLKSFFTEFKDDDVNLVIKCYSKEMMGGTTSSTINKVKRLISEIKEQITSYGRLVEGYKCNVITIPGIIEEEKLSSIYDVVDCFVTCTRGEGFGIPLADFLIHHKKPVLSPDKGGHLDFIQKESMMIESRYEPYLLHKSPFHATCDMNYIEPSIFSARKQMRKMYEIGNKSDKYMQICDKMHNHAKEYLSQENNVQMFKELLGV